jgi:hypothetical protein
MESRIIVEPVASQATILGCAGRAESRMTMQGFSRTSKTAALE